MRAVGDLSVVVSAHVRADISLNVGVRDHRAKLPKHGVALGQGAGCVVNCNAAAECPGCIHACGFLVVSSCGAVFVICSSPD